MAKMILRKVNHLKHSKRHQTLSYHMLQHTLFFVRIYNIGRVSSAGTKLTRGGTPHNGLYGKAPPERGTFFRLEVYKRVRISRVEV